MEGKAVDEVTERRDEEIGKEGGETVMNERQSLTGVRGGEANAKMDAEEADRDGNRELLRSRQCRLLASAGTNMLNKH